MDIDSIRDFIINELANYGHVALEKDVDLFTPSLNIPARDMATLFISISEHYSIDLNSLIPHIHIYSINEISLSTFQAFQQLAE